MLSNITHSRLVRTGTVWAFTLIFSAIILYFLIRDDTWYLLKQLELSVVVVLIGIAILYLLETVFSIKVLLGGMGYNVPYKDLYLVLTASMPANYTTPTKIGVPIRIFLYKKFLNIPFSVGAASIALETAIGFGITSIIALIGVLHLLEEFVLGFELFLTFLFLIVGVLLSVRFIGSFSFLRTRFSNKHFQRIINFGVTFRDSIKTVSIWPLCFVVLLLLSRIIVRVLLTYVILSLFSYQISPLELLYIQSISGIISIVSMLPMGLGARELSLVALLTRVGIPGNVGALVAIIERALWTLIPFILGLISANRLGLKWVMGEIDDKITDQS